MKLLVTGGAGFIGSAVVRLAIRRGYEVVNLDELTYAACLDNVAPVSNAPGYRFIQADICDRAALDKVFGEYAPDAVMHLAAESHVDRSIDGPAVFMETLSAPARRSSLTSSKVLTPPPTVSGTKTSPAVRRTTSIIVFLSS